jgi:hypothetical protein
MLFSVTPSYVIFSLIISQAELTGNTTQAVINTWREPVVMFQTRSHLFDSQQQMYRLQDDVVWKPSSVIKPMLACLQEHDLQRLLLAPWHVEIFR